MRDVCETYRAAPKRLETEGIHTVCVDEKTSIQALEPSAPTKPMRPGLIERREVEYKRHGTRVLIGNFERRRRPDRILFASYAVDESTCRPCGFEGKRPMSVWMASEWPRLQAGHTRSTHSLAPTGK